MSWRAIAAVARADFRERIRRRAFQVVTALLLWASFEAVPPPGTGFSLLAFGDARGVYNSAWFGLMFGLVVVFLLPLPGFYLVKGAVGRDRSTAVGRVVAATPISTWSYLLGKTVSNLLLLVAIVAIVSVGAVGMLLLRREAPGLDPIELLRPIWMMGAPVMAIVAALAVLFECLPGLRGGAGNILYFFVWALGLALVIETMTDADGRIVPQADPLGISHAVAEAQDRVGAAVPDYRNAFRLSIGRTSEEEMIVLPWPQASWSPARLAERAAWLASALLLVLGATWVFDRFDPARSRRVRRPASGWLRRFRSAGEVRRPVSTAGPSTALATGTDQPLPAAVVLEGPRRLGALVAAELRLMARGHPLWWWLVLGGLAIGALVAPLATAHTDLLPFLWLWPVLVFSPLGARDRRYGVDSLIRVAPSFAGRLVVAGWTAGTAVALVCAAPILARLLIAGQAGAGGALLAGAVFIPALALALGAWTGGSRAFEAIYPLGWYLAVNGFVALDFMGRLPTTRAAGWPPIYLAASAALLGLAVVARRRR